jgi:hypothetical protein
MPETSQYRRYEPGYDEASLRPALWCVDCTEDDNYQADVRMIWVQPEAQTATPSLADWIAVADVHEAKHHGADESMTVHTAVSAYTINALPPDDPDADLYELKVEHCGIWEGRELWKVTRGSWILDRDGAWSPVHENHGPDWRATHRFGLDDALRLAKAAAPNVRAAGGMTPAQLVEWQQQATEAAK